MYILAYMGHLRWCSWRYKRHKKCGFIPWVGKIFWIRAWQPTPVFLPGESPWAEKPDGLQSIGSRRVRSTEATWCAWMHIRVSLSLSLYIYIYYIYNLLVYAQKNIWKLVWEIDCLWSEELSDWEEAGGRLFSLYIIILNGVNWQY